MLEKDGVAASMRQELTADHRRLDKLFDDTCGHVRSGDFARATLADAAELAAIVAAHDMKEERILYARSDATLDEPERAQVLAALRL
jgi:hypothetical protein